VERGRRRAPGADRARAGQPARRSALGDIERVRSLLDDLENKQSVAELLDSAREAEATRIFIGSENRLFALSGSS
jgi:heat-inducible transcriptional repressor